MADQVVQTSFRYAVDQNSINAVKRAAAELENALNDGKTELAQYGTVSRAAMDRVESAIEAGTLALREHGDMLDRVRREYEGVEAAAQRASNAGGGRRFNVDTLDSVGSVGSQLASGLGQGELANALGLVGDLAGGLGSLGGILAPVALGVGALTVVYNEQQAAQERVKREIEGYTTALEAERLARQELSALIVGGDTGAIAQQLAQAMSDYDLILNTEYLPMLEKQQARFVELEAEARRVAAGTAGVREDLIPQNEVDELAQAYAGIDPAFQELGATLQALSAETLTPLAQQIAGLSATAQPGAQIIADLRAEEQRLNFERANGSITYQDARARIEEFDQDIGVLSRQIEDAGAQIATAREQENYSLAAALTVFVGQVEAQRDALTRQRDLYQDVALSIGLANAQAEKIAMTEAALADKREKTAEATERALQLESAAAAARGGEYLDSLTAEIAAREALAKVQTELTTAEAASAAKLESIRADLRDKEAAINARADAELLKAEQRAEEQRTKIAADAAKERAKNDDTFAKSAETARANRDQLAERAAKDAYDAELKRINDAEGERLNDLEKALKEQRDTILTSQRQQQQDAQNAARAAIQTEQARWRDEQTIRQNAVNRANADLTNALFAQQAIQQTYYAQQAATMQNAFSGLIDMAFTAGQSLAEAFGAGVELGKFVGGVTKTTTGDFIPRTPGNVPQGAYQTGGDRTLQASIYINGAMTERQTLKMIDDSFGEFQSAYVNLRRAAA